MKRGLIVAGVIVAGIVVLAITRGGKGTPKSAAPSSAAVQKALAGSPPPLAKLHDQASELLPGGTKAFKQRLASLHGHPVVVNKWGAWCGPCRQEFPIFQQLSVKNGTRVAFLGVDSQDNSGDARSFLQKLPVSYPSYEDPDLKIAALMNAVAASPTTVFYSSQGKIVGSHIGQYSNGKELQQDIDKYAR
jgi:cytochrome c biogenesis protein CcmG, thiol:disulfide interchange protein DsbE